METQTIKLSDVIFREDLYPRIKHNQQKVQEYADNLDKLPAIETNQRNELIDGFHRWTAHKLKEAKTIQIFVTKTDSDNHLLTLAIERNAKHGFQLSREDKRDMARRLYLLKTHDKPELVKLLSVSDRLMADWLSDLDRAEKERRDRTIFEMWQQCYTEEEIAEATKVGKVTVHESLCSKIADLQKANKVQFSEVEFAPPIYNVWAFGKKTNGTEHFGNTEQRIVENLIWLYTEPGEIVIDPFGGGGSTLDVCEERGRRCWISDRKPKAGMEKRLRTLDICEELPPLNKRWSEVSLVYLDPPYWRQAAGQYSDDKEDFANMDLAKFTDNLTEVVRAFVDKLKSGSVIALIIQPTQWKSETKGDFTDHVFDLVASVGNKKVSVENRVSCPYSSEQCTPQMVEWAKKHKKLLVISRELIVWRVK